MAFEMVLPSRSTTAMRDPGRLGAGARPREHVAEERGDRDRHRQRQQHRPDVAEEDLQILANQRRDGSHRHQSLSVRPVSDRNTVSSDAPWPPSRPARSRNPASVSSASTRPRSITTMRSAIRSASSM